MTVEFVLLIINKWAYFDYNAEVIRVFKVNATDSIAAEERDKCNWKLAILRYEEHNIYTSRTVSSRKMCRRVEHA
jgi:hypothetical protein